MLLSHFVERWGGEGTWQRGICASKLSPLNLEAHIAFKRLDLLLATVAKHQAPLLWVAAGNIVPVMQTNVADAREKSRA